MGNHVLQDVPEDDLGELTQDQRQFRGPADDRPRGGVRRPLGEEPTGGLVSAVEKIWEFHGIPTFHQSMFSCRFFR